MFEFQAYDRLLQRNQKLLDSIKEKKEEEEKELEKEEEEESKWCSIQLLFSLQNMYTFLC